MKIWMSGIGIWFLTVVLVVFIIVIGSGYEQAAIDFLTLLAVYAFVFSAPLIFPIVLFLYIFKRLPFSFGIAASLLLCMLAFLVVGFFYIVLPWFIGKQIPLGEVFKFIVITLPSLVIVYSFSLNRLRALREEGRKNTEPDVFS